MTKATRLWTIFRPTGKKSITEGLSAGTRSGQCLRSGAPQAVWQYAWHVVPSQDGTSIFYVKSDSTGIFRSAKSGLNEELVFKSENSGLDFIPLLLFPDGKDLLVAGRREQSLRFPFLQNKRHQP